jgi:hypothetical protein
MPRSCSSSDMIAAFMSYASVTYDASVAQELSVSHASLRWAADRGAGPRCAGIDRISDHNS